MSRGFILTSCLAFSALLAASPASATQRTFATSIVTYKIPHGAPGTDAGIDLTGGRYVRITAGGAISLRYEGCGRASGPEGCGTATSFSRVALNAPTGALVVAFADRSGRLLTSWSAVGPAAYVIIPSGASRLLLRVNGATAADSGSFRVVADVVGQQQSASSTTASGGVRRALASLRRVSAGYQLTRADVQYVVRRLGFSDTPENITAIYQSGISSWVNHQLNPSTVDDSNLNTYVDAIPLLTGNSNNPIDQNYGNILEYRLVQRQVATNRQLLEKMTLHWLEHFAVSESKVSDPGAMAHYEDTIRADALGNFQTLVSDVAKEPAMLFWLDNNGNNGNDPKNIPNENFARELMQLYTLGINQLNMDGTPVVDKKGNPIPAYGEPDVKQAALAMCGFYAYTPYPMPTGDPRNAAIETFHSYAHPKGPYTIMGTSVADPGDETVVDNVVKVLAHNPTTAPFEAKELLQRFVTEAPSPGYVTRIATVWQQNVDDPNQLQKVMSAIVNDPEFLSGRGTLVKEPAEYEVDALRAMHGATSNPVAPSFYTLNTVDYQEGAMGQQLWYPPTVFSFYRPGDKESLMTNSTLLQRWGTANYLSFSVHASQCANCNVQMVLPGLSTMSKSAQASYLLDALVDGGTPDLDALVKNLMVSGNGSITDGMWLILSSPEYEVN